MIVVGLDGRCPQPEQGTERGSKGEKWESRAQVPQIGGREKRNSYRPELNGVGQKREDNDGTEKGVSKRETTRYYNGDGHQTRRRAYKDRNRVQNGICVISGYAEDAEQQSRKG